MENNEKLSKIILDESIRNLKKEISIKVDEISDNELKEKMKVLINE